MNVATYNLSNPPFVTTQGRAKLPIDVLLSVFQETHRKMDDTSSGPVRFVDTQESHQTGAAYVDPKAEIIKAKGLESLISVSRVWLSEDIAERLQEIRITLKDLDLLPLRLPSVKSFLLFCFERGVLRRPIMSVTPDGFLQADWLGNHSEKVSIRFLSRTIARITFRTSDAQGTIQVKPLRLTGPEAMVQLPDWV